MKLIDKIANFPTTAVSRVYLRVIICICLSVTTPCDVHVRPVFVQRLFVQGVFVQSYQVRLGYDWTKRRWTKMNWTKSRSTRCAYGSGDFITISRTALSNQIFSIRTKLVIFRHSREGQSQNYCFNQSFQYLPIIYHSILLSLFLFSVTFFEIWIPLSLQGGTQNFRKRPVMVDIFLIFSIYRTCQFF